MKKIIFLIPILLFACAHAAPDRGPEEAAAISKFPLSEAVASLTKTEKEIQDLDGRIRSTESRRDNYRLQANGDPNKENAWEGAEAELASLQSKRTNLEHRRHLIEGRMRELHKDTKDD